MQISPAIRNDSSAISFAERSVCFRSARAADRAYMEPEPTDSNPSSTIVFSGSRTADELIVQRVEESSANITVVTSDRELISRVSRRKVRIVTAQEFVHELRAVKSEQENKEEDWQAYFSDPKNREEF